MCGSTLGKLHCIVEEDVEFGRLDILACPKKLQYIALDEFRDGRYRHFLPPSHKANKALVLHGVKQNGLIEVGTEVGIAPADGAWALLQVVLHGSEGLHFAIGHGLQNEQLQLIGCLYIICIDWNCLETSGR